MSSLGKLGKANTRNPSTSENNLSCGDDAIRLKKMLVSHRREINLGRPFDGGGGGCGGGGGPNSCNSGGATEAVGLAYGDDVSSSSRLGGENFAKSGTTNSQPFDIFSAAAYSVTPYKSPEEMASSAAFPFTFAQWKELERQAMIYKYMISSVPVPSDLLFPLRNFSATPPASCTNFFAHAFSSSFIIASSSSSSSSSFSLFLVFYILILEAAYNVRYSRNGDPETGRCKRTDGKKWRCSRDVAPHQKYCERHLHRGRPRSRKPVEVKNGENLKKTRAEQSHVPTTANASSQQLAAANDKPLLLFNAKTDLTVSAAPSSYKAPTRDLSLMMNGPDQRWQHLMEPNMGFVNMGSSVYGSSSLFPLDYAEHQQPLINALPYSNYSAPEIDAPTGFIDAWFLHNLESNNRGNAESSSITTNRGNLSPSLNLSIAMAAGNIVDQEMGNFECCDEQSGNDPRWISPPFWEPFSQGGPLAEALNSGSVVSSPTGVLHRTLFSHSDGSVCSSPAPAAAPASEIAFHRLN